MRPTEVRVELFCEDRGHELFVRALVSRLAGELAVPVELTATSARGGHGKAISELRLRQRMLKAGDRAGSPSLLIAAIDCNCSHWNTVRQEIEDAIDRSAVPAAVVACPDPHVERWVFADGEAFRRIVGATPPRDPGKCARDAYKELLRSSLASAGVPVLGSEMDVAPDIVRAMDLYRAAKAQPSLGRFVDDLRAALRRLGKSGSVWPQ